jgi:hypothetical protein
LKRFGTFWNVLERFGTFWNILERFGTFWNVLERFGTFWKWRALEAVAEGINYLDIDYLAKTAQVLERGFINLLLGKIK